MLGALLAVLWAAPSSGPAHAQGKLEARYAVTIAGIPIGRGAWIVDISEDQYTTTASGRVTGLMRAVTSGEGSAGARGLVNGGRLVPTSYALSVNAEDKADVIRMALSGGIVKELVLDPPTIASPDRIPVTDTHRQGVIDPLTAGLVLMAGANDVVTAEACQRTLPIFDGRQRYDLTLSFKRMDKVKADRGYQGPVVVCMVTYQPLAGHRPERSAIKHLTQTHDIEMWLAPIAGTRFLAPFRISIPTMIGSAVLEATQFVTLVQPARPTSAKTQ